MKNIFRASLRKAIGFLAKRTIAKHNPLIIAVIGNGSTSIAREVIYAALNEALPGRRNLELPEAEFSVPLTILDYPGYPQSILGWLWLLVKTSLQLWSIKPYKHLLVLEMQPLSSQVLDYWLEITQPQFVVQVGALGANGHSRIQGGWEKLSVDEGGNQDVLEPYIRVAKELGTKLHIDDLDVELGLESLDFPEPRVRFWRSKAGGNVIDATYYYFPIRLESVLEIAESFEGNPICFTSDAEDKRKLAAIGGWEVNPVNYSPKTEDVILLRGLRTQDFPKYKRYLFTHTPFI